ncbi:MAG: efflux RND transporter periplasmic adaptor subunit [Luteolibacter sp.]
MKVALKIIIPIVIIALAIAGFKVLGLLKPEPKSKQPKEVVPIVDLVTVSPENHRPPVRTFGKVSSYFETGLTPQVSGKITYVSDKFRTGEMVGVEEVLVKIDPTDFESALAVEESNLTVAERSLAEEEIRAEQAAGDWEASGRDLASASDFVLRKPQLAAAKAGVEAAKAAVNKATADLERAEVRAPFPAIITARSASPGNQASPQAMLGTLISTDKVEIRLPLTADQVARVQIPSKAEVSSPLKPGATWEAMVVRMEPTVDEQNQVVYVVAEVEEPFANMEEPLPVGIFANVSIEASSLAETYEIPEAAYVNDQYVWVMDEEGKLKRLEAERLLSFEGSAYVVPKGSVGELKVVSRPLSNFRKGMKVREAEEEAGK